MRFGRTLNRFETAVIFLAFLLILFLAPKTNQLLIETILFLAASIYNAGVSRGGLSFVFVAIAVVFVLIAVFSGSEWPSTPLPEAG